MNKRRIMGLLAILVAFAFVAAACGDDDDSGSSSAASETSSDASSDASSDSSSDTESGSDEVDLTASGDTRLTPREEQGYVGVLSAEQSQSGREVDFGIFEGKTIGVV